MEEESIYAVTIQETWLEGNFQLQLPGEKRLIHHGPPTQDSKRGRGGVAIILSKQAVQDWERNNFEIEYGGTEECGTTRLLAVVTKPLKGGEKKSNVLKIVSAYFPDSAKNEETLKGFYESFKDICKVNSKSTLIVGADTNAATGRSKSGEKNPVGPYGNPHVNNRGKKLIDLLKETNLKDTTSFFKHKRFNTWFNHLDNKPYALDKILVQNNCKRVKVTDSKVVVGGAQSDHLPVKLTLKIRGKLSDTGRTNNQIKKKSKSESNPRVFKTNPEKLLQFQKEVDLFISKEKPEYDEFAKRLTKIYKDHTNEETKSTPDWFERRKTVLIPLIVERNAAFDRLLSQPSEQAKKQLQKIRKELKREKRKAKAFWQKEIARECTKHAFANDPKRAWKACNTILEGFQGHLTKITPQQFANSKGDIATTDKENTTILRDHFQKVFDRREVQIDETILNEIDNLEINGDVLDAIKGEPTIDEVKSAIKKMKCGTAPGTTGVTSDMLKALSENATEYITETVVDFWNNKRDVESWHQMNLTALYKGKGETHDPNNWRGVCLKELGSKILSSIISTRLLAVLHNNNVPEQFATAGCQEAMHTLRTILQTRRAHGLESYVLFVDLVKAYDTVNQPLLFAILRKFGLPDELVSCIEKLYKDCNVKIQIGDITEVLNYYTGVQQGDNVAPSLFLLFMLAVSLTLKKKWKFQTPKFGHFKQTKWNKSGRLKNQNFKVKGDIFELFHILFVDDSTFIFETPEELVNGVKEIQQHYARFGLIMHVGKNGKKSKTEAMHIPARLNEEPTKDGTTINISDNEHINFTTKFKYLGSKITSNLSDELDINTRIATASNQVYKMRHLFSSNEVSLRVKVMMYIAIPLNTVLWGCETWSLKSTDMKALETFHNSSIRRILKINMKQVKEERITNEEIRKRFHNIHKLEDYITRRSLTYLGKTIRTEGDAKLQKCCITAFCHSPKMAGGQQKNHRDLFVKHIKKVLPNTSNDAPLKEWAKIALDKTQWREHLKKWWELGENK